MNRSPATTHSKRHHGVFALLGVHFPGVCNRRPGGGGANKKKRPSQTLFHSTLPSPRLKMRPEDGIEKSIREEECSLRHAKGHFCSTPLLKHEGGESMLFRNREYNNEMMLLSICEGLKCDRVVHPGNSGVYLDSANEKPYVVQGSRKDQQVPRV